MSSEPDNPNNREGGYMCRCRECQCGPFPTVQGKANHEAKCHLLLHERMMDLGSASEPDDDVPGNLFLDSDDETIYSRTNWSDISSVPSLEPRDDCDFSRNGEEDQGGPNEEMDPQEEEDFYSTKGDDGESQDPSEAFHDIEAIDINPKSPEGMELNFEPIYFSTQPEENEPRANSVLLHCRGKHGREPPQDGNPPTNVPKNLG